MPRMRIAEVNIAEHVDRCLALLDENWAETGFDFPLDPDRRQYIAAQEAGILFALAAFDGEEVVGYSTAFVSPHHFNPAVVMCHSDALFVARSHRDSSAGARLIAETERVARERGAHRMLWHTRAGTALADVLSSRPAYQPADVVVVKDLSHGP